MAKVRGFEVPENLYYDVKNHVWVKPINENQALLGIDDIGQYLAKKIVFVKPKPPGSPVPRGSPFAIVESIKWVGALISPLTCSISEVNRQVIARPSILNEKPYEAWIVKVRADDLSNQLKSLATGADAVKLQEIDLEKRGISGRGV